ncbi:MAG: glycosyltransferase [Candidatus Pacebacteria bacterium]|nr:glycosyltransferase [Candidatus Paceibacterota bacterium]
MAHEENPLLSIVVPVYNERESILPLYEEIKAALVSLPHTEIIFIDDGSRDGTLDILKSLQGVSVISFVRNYGKSKALEAGFHEARGNYIITLDGDLQDDPAEIPRFLWALQDGSDLVTGWKVHRRDPFEKRFVSKIANGVTRILAGSPVHDMNCGFKGYKAEVAKGLQFFGDMHRYIPAVVLHQGYVVSEIPINHRERKFGHSKYGVWRLFAGFFDLLTLLFIRRFFDRPMHFFGVSGILAGGAGSVVLIYLAWLRLELGETIGNRPLLFLGILLVVVGFQLLSLGLISELMVRQRDSVPTPTRFVRRPHQP